MAAPFAINPSAALRNITPEVPACTYQFIPTGTFKLSGMAAKVNDLVNVTFRLAPPSSMCSTAAACITLDAAAPLVGVGNYPNCPAAVKRMTAASSATPSAAVLPKLINIAKPACVDGEYSVLVKVPYNFRTKKCFNIGVKLADGTTRRAIVAITARKAAAAAQP
uniref:Uncharacterized protein n=1 Tax=Tetradesmus obliquus TaxID=3088 RepID=A0A383VD75_TETOB|eukprot:jgi/Sobl393_1/17465/SZX62719.1